MGAPKLLVVDDEPHVVSAVRRSLRGESYQVFGATRACDGLALLAAHRVQVILSDQHMPQHAGGEFLAQVMTLYPDTVRIVLSGHSPARAIRRAIDCGAIHDFITKPWDNEPLRVRLREAFRHYRDVIAPRLAAGHWRCAVGEGPVTFLSDHPGAAGTPEGSR